jgi:predicted TIM-barrel fold metal-dependent hydrolase
MRPVKPFRGIDAHAHVFSATAAAVAGARYRPAYAASLEAWQGLWPASGITHGVLVQPSFLGTDNSEMLAAIARDPGRLRGVAVVDEHVGDATLHQLHEGGVRAIRLNLRGISDWSPYAMPGWRALFDRLHHRGWHVEAYFDPGRATAIAGLLPEAPIPVVLDHFAMPGGDRGSIDATFAAVKELCSQRPVWLKLSGPYRLEGGDAQMLAERWLETVGPGRLVWGSDWPWTLHEGVTSYARLRDALDRWAGVRRVPAVLWDNAAQLYDFH